MVNKIIDEKIFKMHADVCKALSSPVRLKILYSLRKGERPVEEMANLLSLHKANLSQHLAILRQLKIVTARRSGLNIYYAISNKKMMKACDILREILFEQLSEDEKLARRMLQEN